MGSNSYVIPIKIVGATACVQYIEDETITFCDPTDGFVLKLVDQWI